VLVVGAGPAGSRCAETLRAEGFTGRVVLIGAEPERPYERPPLSKELLLGTGAREKVYVHPPDWYARNDVELRTGTRVDRIDPAVQELSLAGGERLRYDVLHLRTLADSDRIGAALTDGARVVVIGAGWIGLEVAAAARQHGAAVTVVEAAPLPLRRALGDEVGRLFADLHRAHGVGFHFGTGVRELRGAGRVSTVLLDTGAELAADAVIVGVGARPLTALADRAGLPVDDGVLVDTALRTTDPHIYAAGDVANAEHPLLGRRIRVEHWSHARHSGAAAARAMLGQPVSYDRLPYFFTDQYDLGMEYVGWAEPGGYDRVVFRGDVAGREFLAFWVRGGRVIAGMNVNVWDVQEPIQALVRAGYEGRTVDLARLAEPAVPLADLLG
jgi:NADPH-dependent 2,4-dienoyl-CoA reductase/sulfur reductase-like enzyme